MIRVGYIGTDGLSIDVGKAVLVVQEPRKEDVYYLGGCVNKDGRYLSIHFKVKELEAKKQGFTDNVNRKLSLECEFADYNTSEILEHITLHLSGNWHEFEEVSQVNETK